MFCLGHSYVAPWIEAPALVLNLRQGGSGTKAGYIDVGAVRERSSCELARAVLGGARGAHRDIVLLNAAAGLVVAGIAESIAEGVERAATAIDSAAAATALERMVAVSNQRTG